MAGVHGNACRLITYNCMLYTNHIIRSLVQEDLLCWAMDFSLVFVVLQ